MSIKVLVIGGWLKDMPEAEERLQEVAGFDFLFKSDGDCTEEDFALTEVIIGNLPKEVLKKFKRLKWVQLVSSGVDAYTETGAFPEQAQLTNATGSFGLTIAEHLLAQTMMLQRKFHLYLDNQRQGTWKREGSIQSIHGSVVLIVGFGDIGTEYAKRVQALGGYTIGVKRRIYGDEAFVDELYTVDQLDDLLGRADVVVSSLPSTPATFKLFNKERLLKLKENAVFLNVGRGDAVDLEALCQIMEEGRLWGASLDVTDPEPLPDGHPAWFVPNLLITPHISGNYSLGETNRRILELCTTNLALYRDGKPLLNQVDFQAGYRKKILAESPLAPVPSLEKKAD